MKLTPPTSLEILTRDLGIQPPQLSKLRVKYKTHEKLIAVLQAWWLQTREQPRLLARRSVQGYTHERGEAMHGHLRDEGYEDEPEAVDPAEIAGYRASRDARIRHQQDRVEEQGELLAAMHNLRAVIDEMPSERKRVMSKTLWTLRSRLDSAEREMRRRLAA